MRKLIPLIAVALFMVGCQTLFTGITTLTDTVDSASKEYAKAYNDGLVTAAIHLKVVDAHANYQKAAGIARDALYAYKLSGDPAQFNAAFDAARQAAIKFIDVIAPLLTPAKAAALKTNATKAIAL